jgi:taspase (threonine aspartase 1)
MNSFIIVLHAGAGKHDSRRTTDYESIVRNALQRSQSLAARSGVSAVDVVERAMFALEESELCNAGYGSNFNLLGDVECDACVVECRATRSVLESASVAAVPDMIHASTAACQLLRESRLGALSLGRIRPTFLCESAGDGGVCLLQLVDGAE